MAETRSTSKGNVIDLELYEIDLPSGVSVTSIDSVIILQDKEICYLTTAITHVSSGVWRITVNTGEVLYDGQFHDRWVLNGGAEWVEKTLSIVDYGTNASASRSYTYYSKDLSFVTKPDGDLYRLYDDNAIAAKVEAVIMTIRGSLFNEPEHGTSLWRFLFSTSPHVAEDIRLEIETQLQKQVPQIMIKQVRVIASDYNAYNVDIDFYIITSATPNELLNMTNLVSIEKVVGR